MPGVKGKSGGHNRKPTRHKQLVGEKHKARTQTKEPDRVEGNVLPMASLDEYGQRIFDYYGPMLENNGTMSRADAFAFTMLCKKAADWMSLVQNIDRRKLTFMNNKGDEKIAPLIKLEMQTYDQLTKMMREFGLTPVSRASVVKIGKNENELPFKGITG